MVGIEGGAAGGNIGGSTAFATPGIPGDTTTFRETTDLLTSVTGRVGYSWDRWLFYGKGGAAWTANRYGALDTLATYDYEGSETRFGWTAGVGVEWMLWHDWSLKLEYDYYGFGTRSVTFIDNVTGNVGPENINQTIQIVKLGLNFHVFAGAAPVVPLGWRGSDGPHSLAVSDHATGKRARMPRRMDHRLATGIVIGHSGNGSGRSGARG